MFTFFSLIIFFGILFGFGWQLARFIFSEKRIEALIPLAAILGSGLYFSFLVYLSYLINIQINFYLLLVIFIVLSCFLYRANKGKEKPAWSIDKKWRIILFVTLFLIMVFTAFVGMRSLAEAARAFPHLPLAATIAEGNFPVMAIFAPDFPSQYHHGYNIVSAAITKITRLPIWFSYDAQNALFMGITFLFGFLFIRELSKSNFKAYLASLVMVLGGNLNLLFAIDGLSSLFQKEVSFRFLYDMIFGKVALAGQQLIPYHVRAPWVMLGFALTMGAIYLYFKAVNDEKNWLKISLLTVPIFSFLALSAEGFFGVLSIIFLIYPFVFAILKKDWKTGKLCLKISLLILFLGWLIALLQGGIVTETFKQRFLGYSLPENFPVSITPTYLLRGLIFADENFFIQIFSSDVFLGWGWFIIFIIPTAIFVLRKYFQLGLFLLLLILISVFLPLIMTAGASGQADFMRINYIGTLFWNLFFGLFLGWLLLFFAKKWQRALLIILILAVTFQGLSYFVLFSIFPGLERGQPFIANDSPELNATEAKAVSWVKKNTTIKDYFLTFGEEPTAVDHNAKFVIYTGRFAPRFFYGAIKQATIHPRYRYLEDTIPQIADYREVMEECPAASLRVLKYSYLYVNEYWPAGLEEKCLANNNLELKFEASSGNNFARIYELQ